MSIKKTLLAAVVAAFAFAALPGMAVADEVHYDDPHFTVTGGTTQLETKSGNEVHCKKVTGTGEFEDKPGKTGTIHLIFEECTAFGTNCQSSGAATGTITTTDLPFHVVRLTYETEDKTIDDTPGVLITPNTVDTSGTPHFATFKCAGGLVTVVVRGNGVIGHILTGYDVETSTFEIAFETNAAGTDQEFVHYFDAHTNGQGGAEEHTTRGPFRLESSLNGGAFEQAYQIGTGELHASEGESIITTTHTE